MISKFWKIIVDKTIYLSYMFIVGIYLCIKQDNVSINTYISNRTYFYSVIIIS